MKKYVYLAGIAITALLFSCNKQQDAVQLNAERQPGVTDSLPAFEVNVKMAYIPGGEYKPFYGSDTELVEVEPFLLDERPVTNGEFLQFVQANPKWRKSRVLSIYADSSYLSDWPADITLPENANPDAPVCNVSWFAARAFAQSVGKRLPTLDEWEFVAMADAVSPNARSKPQYSDAIIDLYLQKYRQYQPVKQSDPNYWGVYNMFDLIWEWTADFNAVLTTGDSRSGQYEDKNLFCAGGATSATDVLNYAAYMRFALRNSVKANYSIANLGFRCAKDTPKNTVK